MPTYQYACTECGHRFEAVQAFTDPSLSECPQCHGQLRKVYGSVGVVFKGSGFYRTDSRSGAGSKVHSHAGASSENGSANGSATSGDASSSTSGGTSGSATPGKGKGSSGTGNGSSSSSSSSSSAPAKAAAG